MKTPSFSIIIPHYNIPDLLMRCLKSIPVSDDIQVIVVDDNSPDADTYLERYSELSRPYLEFIRTSKGGGAGYARNVGIDYANGKWLLFADADDSFVENMYEVIKPYEESKADIVFFRSKCVFSDNYLLSSEKGSYIDKLIDSYFNTKDDTYIRLHWCPPWGKMIKKDYIIKGNFRFDEVQYGNDYYFSICTGVNANSIEVVNSLLYVYMDRNNSLTASFCSKPNELAIRAEVSYRIQLLLNNHNIQIEQLTPFGWYFGEMLKKDRKLFDYYFEKIDKIYPSKVAAMRSISQNRSISFKCFMAIYMIFLLLKHYQ